jgi:hypothetical protein
MKATTLLLLGCVFLLGTVEPSAAQESGEEAARRIIRKAIVAHGGKENLVKSCCPYCSRGKGTLFAGNNLPRPFTFEYWQQDFDHTRMEMHLAFRDGYIPSIRVLNGATGWEQHGATCSDLPDSEINAARQGAHEAMIHLLYPLLEEPGFSLGLLGESTVFIHQVVGVRVRHRGRPDVRLYFDKTNGFLIKSEAPDTLQGKTVLREEFYSNYKDLDGRKYPAEVLFLIDGKKYLAIETLEMQMLEKVDPVRFLKP